MMRLPETVRAAFVIGRRDFTATVLSKTFLFFLLGPLFPLILGFTFGGIAGRVDKNITPPAVAVVAPLADYERIAAARERLSGIGGDRPLVQLRHVAPAADGPKQVQELLTSEDQPVLGVLEGGLFAPHFTGAVNADGRTIKQMEIFISDAHRAQTSGPEGQPMTVTLTKSSAGTVAVARSLTARAGQLVLFVLTLMLATMLLSQLVEEKSNKVIEVLSAAVPVDAIFLGKLFAMLCISIVGIVVWSCAGAAAIAIYAKGGLGALPSPAVGWPTFITLLIVYFAMSYLLIGATFLGIGAQASTVREVQTLSMPVTMAQVFLFGFAQLGVGKPESQEAIASAIFPLSSPFAMIARAAEIPTLWPHLVALAWQALWVALILRMAAKLFRRSVLKSGKSFRWPFRAWATAALTGLGLSKASE